MKQIKFSSTVTRRVAEIEEDGGDCTGFDKILDRLCRGREAPDQFRDHALGGKLKGLRSVVVGWTSEGRDVIMVYQLSKQYVTVLMVDEHDQAYDLLRTEKRLKRRR